MLELKTYSALIVILCASLFTKCTSENSSSPNEPDVTTGLSITVAITVAGEIQVDDPWISGSQSTNEWAKPMYRIWFDGNGKIEDGPYGNGAGPRQAEIWMDTGNLNFIWYGPDSKPGSGDDVKYQNMFQVTTTLHSKNDISGVIKNNNKTLEVCLPLYKIGLPTQLEIGTMTSPWTTSACDNLGQGAYSTACWMCFTCGGCGSKSAEDPLNDASWPGELSPNRASNFDITLVEVSVKEMR